MAGRRLDVDLHETLSNVRSLYLLGQGGLADFASLKQVEIRVRAMAGFSNDSVGTQVMTDAFRLKPEFGPHTDPDAEGGVREAIMFLFRGAIGTFKNPQSHRAVDDDDPVLASEIVLLADLLMRLLVGSRRAKAPPESAAERLMALRWFRKLSPVAGTPQP